MCSRVVRALIVLATSALVVCGVKGPPRPPPSDAPDAGTADGGTR
jgi:predicted small lipoprotein YifL